MRLVEETEVIVVEIRNHAGARTPGEREVTRFNKYTGLMAQRELLNVDRTDVSWELGTRL